jgi:hypothetical protein
MIINSNEKRCCTKEHLAKKKLIIGCSLVASVLLIGLAVVIWLFYSLYAGILFGYKPPEVPAELHDPRVILGQDFLSREKFFRTGRVETATEVLKKIGTVEDIAVGELDGRPGIDVVIAGRYGAIITDRDGVKRSHTQYEFERKNARFGISGSSPAQVLLGDIRIIDIEDDHVCEYLGRGSVNGAAVFAHDGKRLWSYGRFTDGKTYIDDLAAGDVDGDGVLEFIAGWGDSIELFNRYGKRNWAQVYDSLYYQAEVVDVDGDGKNEIIHSSGSTLTVRNAQGSLLKDVEMPFYFSHFSLCDAPGSSRPYILAVKDGALWLTDFEGKVVAQFDAPLSKLSANVRKTPHGEFMEEEVFKSEGTWVKFSDLGPEYLAVIANFAALDRSLLYVYRADGKLLYQEVLPGECNAITALPKSESKLAQVLIVGGEQMVWRYEPR